MNSNRIKKLYLVDENQLRSGKIPETTTSISGSSNIISGGDGIITAENNSGQTGGARNALKDQRDAILSNPLSDPLEKEVWLLDEKVKKVLHDKTLPAWLKIREYLRAIRKFIRMRDLLLRRESEKSEPQIIRQHQTTIGTEMEQPQTMETQTETSLPMFQFSSREAQQQSSGQPHVQFDPSSVFKFDVKYYSPRDILRGVDSRIKPRFKKMVENLQSMGNFEWDERTGVVKINGHEVVGTNIKDLILHRLKSDLPGVPGDAPHRYHLFEKYLKDHGITTTVATRSSSRKGLVKSSRGIKATRPRDVSERPLKKRKVVTEEEDDTTDDDEEDEEEPFHDTSSDPIVSGIGRKPLKKIRKLVSY